MNRQLRGSLLLFLTAFIWGTSFVAQKSGMDSISPVAFNGIRTLIGGVALLPVLAVMQRRGARNADEPASSHAAPASSGERRLLIAGGFACGLFLLAAGNVQQIGMCYTTAGKSGFVTALYVILVPLIGSFMGKKIRPVFWACVAASVAGLYLLCIPVEGGFAGVNKGDVITLACAFLFAGHILCIDYLSPRVDGVKLSCIQFFVAGGISCILSLFVDPALGYALPDLGDLRAGWFQLFYSGVMSCGAGFTLQILAQKDVNPTLASMIMCLESVFAVLAGAVILGESMGLREITGCLLMFAAILVAQLPGRDDSLPSGN